MRLSIEVRIGRHWGMNIFLNLSSLGFVNGFLRDYPMLYGWSWTGMTYAFWWQDKKHCWRWRGEWFPWRQTLGEVLAERPEGAGDE